MLKHLTAYFLGAVSMFGFLWWMGNHEENKFVPDVFYKNFDWS